MLSWLMRADAFDRRPLSHFGNQLGHAALGYLGVMLFGLPGVGGAIFLAGLYFVAWERLAQKGPSLRDSAEDALHLLFGALLAWASGPVFWALLAGWAVVMGVGLWRRWWIQKAA